ncbi:MAG: CPBP family intramembrane metalloprotease [Ardenticatenaceae bacterium]|nr:CPBP family intramembrane metalloprotease [Ardenticatenaceae bacterium]
MDTTTPKLTDRRDSPWWEILVVMGASLSISLFFPSLEIVGILIPIAYLIIEHHLRHRTWIESGFQFKNLPQDLLHNWGWVLLVSIGFQALSVFGAYFLLPEFSSHVLARLPFDLHTLNAGLFSTILVVTLGEEIIYRALFQKRLSGFLPVSVAILLSSLTFALMHYASGPALIVFTDLALIFVDSVVYGIIFARSNNVFASWIAHFLADVFGIIFLLVLMWGR